MSADPSEDPDFTFFGAPPIRVVEHESGPDSVFDASIVCHINSVDDARKFSDEIQNLGWRVRINAAGEFEYRPPGEGVAACVKMLCMNADVVDVISSCMKKTKTVQNWILNLDGDVFRKMRGGDESAISWILEAALCNVHLTFIAIQQIDVCVLYSENHLHIAVSESNRIASKLVFSVPLGDGYGTDSGDFELMPNEMLCEIVAHMCARDIIEMAWVCRRWRDCAYSDYTTKRTTRGCGTDPVYLFRDHLIECEERKCAEMERMDRSYAEFAMWMREMQQMKDGGHH